MGKKHGEAKSRLGSMLCFTVYSTAHAFNRAYKPLLDALGLTYPQYLAMFALWESDNLAVKELGELLHLDSGTLTPLLKRLEGMGLVRRARDPADERSVRISLTPKGLDMKCKERTVHEGLISACGHTAEELKSLTAALIRVRDGLDAAAERAEAAGADEKSVSAA
ncbi:MAG TPA: MarR family transcriptional regulator [Xanthobacteraceae bacterium]|nr:MarR family transcriptional regulator [Xanthobacteraceae bacterium]